MNKKEKRGQDVEVDLLQAPINKQQESAQIKETEQDRGAIISFLTQQSDELAKEAAVRKKKRDNEKIQFIGGMNLTIKEVGKVTCTIAAPYEPLFPNEVPFFKQMYKLLGWTDMDPNSYFKPSIVGYYVLVLIYRRFDKDVLQELRASAIPGGVRLYKFFQFLNEEGQQKVIQHRDEALELMNECESWLEFRKKFANKYDQPFYTEQKLF